MGREREFLGHGIDTQHRTAVVGQTDSRLANPINRGTDRVSSKSLSTSSFSLLLSLAHFFGFCFIDGRVDGAGCVCIS